jgi:tellurite resistance protein
MSGQVPLYVEPEAEIGGRLPHLPVTFFAVVMGLAGTSLAWRRAAQTLEVSSFIGETLAWTSLAAYALVGAAYLAKVLLHRDAVVAELRHPVRLTFIPTITIALLLVATALADVAPGFAEVLWWIGAAGQLPATFYVLQSWVTRPGAGLQPVTPAWFIPVVGTLAVPLAGPGFGQVEISWFYFSLGIVFWVGLLPIVLARLFVHESPVPPKLLPTLAVLVAPPAVAFLAYLRLAPVDLDPFARVLYYSALAFFGLLLTQLPRLAKLPFFLSWWAYSFPLAALTAATLAMAQSLGKPAAMIGLSWTLLVALSALIIALAARTLRAMLGGEICVPE